MSIILRKPICLSITFQVVGYNSGSVLLKVFSLVVFTCLFFYTHKAQADCTFTTPTNTTYNYTAANISNPASIVLSGTVTCRNGSNPGRSAYLCMKTTYSGQTSSISGKVIYNVEDQEFVENNADTNFIYNDLSLTLGYYKTKYTENIFNDREDLESYRIVTSYKIAKDYKLSYYENYNLLDNIRSKQGVSLNINDSCWNMDIRYENEVVPSSRVNYEAIDQKIIFVNVMLKPLGGIKQKYKMEDNN